MNPLLSLMPWAIGFYGALMLSYELFGSHLVSYALAAFSVYYSKPVAGMGIERYSRILKARQKFYFFADKIVVLGSPVETIEYAFILSVLLAGGGVLIVFGVYAVLPVAGGMYRFLLVVAIAPPLALLYRGLLLYAFSEKGLQRIVESSFDSVESYKAFNLSRVPSVYLRRSKHFDIFYVIFFRLGKASLWLLLLPLLVHFELERFLLLPVVFISLNAVQVMRCVWDRDHFERLRETVSPGPYTLSRVPYREVVLR